MLRDQTRDLKSSVRSRLEKFAGFVNLYSSLVPVLAFCRTMQLGDGADTSITGESVNGISSASVSGAERAVILARGDGYAWTSPWLTRNPRLLRVLPLTIPATKFKPCRTSCALMIWSVLSGTILLLRSSALENRRHRLGMNSSTLASRMRSLGIKRSREG